MKFITFSKQHDDIWVQGTLLSSGADEAQSTESRKLFNEKFRQVFDYDGLFLSNYF